jgi:AraC-like DNA-binding protein
MFDRYSTFRLRKEDRVDADEVEQRQRAGPGGASGDVARVAESHGVRAARLRAIKMDVLQALGDHHLTVTAIAARHQVTPATCRCCSSEGTTFSGFLLLQRLAVAHRMLCDPRFADRMVSAIAFEAGFGDLSHFNRDFRRRSGGSPSDVVPPPCAAMRLETSPRRPRIYSFMQCARNQSPSGRTDRRADWSALGVVQDRCGRNHTTCRM